MKNLKIKKLILSILIILSLMININAQENLTAKQVVKNAKDLFLGKSSVSDMTMTIIRPEWTRSISMQSWSMGSDYYMILITAPARDKGQVFMKRKSDMWNWMPSIDRMIKIPPSMMMQSWMGSDFTNEDLMKENSIITDYTHKFIGNETIENYDCYKIELIPLPEAPVVWGKIIMWIAKKDFYQLKAEYYDDNIKLVNLETCTEIEKMGDRSLPTKLTMTPMDKKGQKTIIDITYQKFNIPTINEIFFSQQMMQRLRERK
ncbi:MAG: outer membrane lipoprotein-sorting protein [Bacteroidales bacterium]|nr:outer membrane lipoprotein-sorting protein [Bacteroidales bacterium]